MTNRITFSQFDRVLTDLGFGKKIVPESCITYEHPSTEALVVVRLHEPNESVPDYVMAATLHHLEWRGVIDPKDFEQMLQKTAA